jgi:hypothetical protein
VDGTKPAKLAQVCARPSLSSWQDAANRIELRRTALNAATSLDAASASASGTTPSGLASRIVLPW